MTVRLTYATSWSYKQSTASIISVSLQIDWKKSFFEACIKTKVSCCFVFWYFGISYTIDVPTIDALFIIFHRHHNILNRRVPHNSSKRGMRSSVFPYIPSWWSSQSSSKYIAIVSDCDWPRYRCYPCISSSAEFRHER